MRYFTVAILTRDILNFFPNVVVWKVFSYLHHKLVRIAQETRLVVPTKVELWTINGAFDKDAYDSRCCPTYDDGQLAKHGETHAASTTDLGDIE